LSVKLRTEFSKARIILLRVVCADSKMESVCEIKIRAAHEIMAARTTQFAFLIDQLMSALQAKPPMFAGNIFVRRRGTGGIIWFFI